LNTSDSPKFSGVTTSLIKSQSASATISLDTNVDVAGSSITLSSTLSRTSKNGISKFTISPNTIDVSSDVIDFTSPNVRRNGIAIIDTLELKTVNDALQGQINAQAGLTETNKVNISTLGIVDGNQQKLIDSNGSSITALGLKDALLTVKTVTNSEKHYFIRNNEYIPTRTNLS
jgi:hypothetical protein